MSEWVDFVVYAISCVVMWIVMPYAYRHVAVPMVMDRNADWAAANPEIMQRIARSRWFTNSCIAWGVVCVTLLLLVQLQNLQIPGVPPHKAQWQLLNSTYNLLFAIGMIGFAAGAWLGQRLLKSFVPPGQRRSATLQPRSHTDAVPLAWRVATEALTLVLLAAWVAAGVTGFARTPKLWDGFAFLLFISAVFAVVARAAARRPPNYLDRLLGNTYRRREIRTAYGVRLGIVAFGAFALVSMIVGPEAMPVNPVRLTFLMFQLSFVALLLPFILIKPEAQSASPPTHSAKSLLKGPGLAGSLLLLIAIPILATATTASMDKPDAQNFALQAARMEVTNGSLPIQQTLGRIASWAAKALAKRIGE